MGGSSGSGDSSDLSFQDSDGGESNANNDGDDVVTQSEDERNTNLITDAGDLVSQGDLPNVLDSITSGSGEVLVNLGDAVSTLGESIELDPQEMDENYLSNIVEGAAQTTTKLGTTVDSLGDTVAQLDVLPVFVQLNNKTGVLTYAGGTVSELGGVVENLGGYLEYHTSNEEGALYGVSHGLSAITAPIVVQLGNTLDLKGNALILFEDKEDAVQTLPQFVFN
ncbi:collagen-like triple helix repeat-containing protein [Vibrio olivae]